MNKLHEVGNIPRTRLEGSHYILKIPDAKPSEGMILILVYSETHIEWKWRKRVSLEGTQDRNFAEYKSLDNMFMLWIHACDKQERATRRFMGALSMTIYQGNQGDNIF